MTESQYKRANKTVLILISVILAYFIFATVASGAAQSGGMVLIRTVVTVAMLIGTIVSYV